MLPLAASGKVAHGASPSPVGYQYRRAPSAKKQWKHTALLLLTFALFCVYYIPCDLLSLVPEALGRITPSLGSSSKANGIQWSTCADDPAFQCGWLTVPMDYANTTYTDPGDVYHLALRKYPATADKKLRKGALVINPGGPGGSGHNAVVRFGKDVSAIADGRFDVIGFDPRGVNMTLPSLDCFEREEQHMRHSYDIHRRGSLLEVRSSLTDADNQLRRAAEEKHLRKTSAHNAALAQQCSQYGNEKVLKTSSTAFVARDIKSIFEALGQEDVYYYGFSYGTILGAVFAQMFPELAHRMVLDGVADADYYHNDLARWSKSGMVDTSKVLAGFFSFCAEAGPAHCALARDNLTTAEGLEDNYQNLLQQLANDPLPVASSKGSGIMEASDVQDRVFNDIYKPNQWPALAQFLFELQQGNGTSALQSRYIPLNPPEWDDNLFKSHMSHTMDYLALGVIMCGDTRAKMLEQTSYFDLAIELEAMSPVGETWARFLDVCKHWTIEPLEVFRGPFNLTDTPVKIRHPVLFVGNTYDPVTPLSSAHRMHDLFGSKNAGLLTHNGYGHCSSAQPSLCTAKHIRSYLLDGTLPPPGIVCEPDRSPFKPHSAALQELEEDAQLLESIRSLADKLF